MTDTPAPAPSDKGTPDAAPPPAPTNWIDGIADNDLKGWAQNKGFKDPVAALDSYRNLEKLMGADRAGRTVVLPTKWDDPKEVQPFYEKLGVPKDPTGYKMPKDADPDMAKWASATFHEAGLTPRQAELVANKWNEMAAGRTEAMKTKYAETIAADQEALKKEWGAAYDDKLTKAKSAAKGLGVDAETVDKLENALGFGGLMKFFSGLGEKMGESSFVEGSTSGAFGGAKTPAQALAEIGELRKDAEFVKRFIAGDTEAKAKMEQLHKWAYPDAP